MDEELINGEHEDDLEIRSLMSQANHNKLVEHGYAPKIYHRAKLISNNGDVSPLCAKIPRKLNLVKELWTNRDEAVTCHKCLAIIINRGK
jgi:hypothetical protein